MNNRVIKNDNRASIATIILLGAVAVAGFNIQPMYLGALADHLGFSPDQLGVLAGLEVAGSALAGIVATCWIRLWNWRVVAAVSMVSLVVGNVVSAFVSDFQWLALLRSLTGFLGVGTSYALAIAALGDTQRVDRNFSIAVVAQVSMAILAFTLLPPVIESAGVAVVFNTLALLAVAVLPFLRFLPRGGKAADTTTHERRPTSARPIWMVLICQCAWYTGVGGVWAFVERLGNEAGIDASGIGTALAIGMAVGLIGAFAAAGLANRFGRVVPFAIAMTGQLLAVWMLSDLQGQNGLILAVCLFNGSWNFALPYIFALAAVADSHGRLVVLMSTAQAIGITLGAMVGGSVVARFGLSAITYQGGLAALLALAIFASVALTLRNNVQRSF